MFFGSAGVLCFLALLAAWHAEGVHTRAPLCGEDVLRYGDFPAGDLYAVCADFAPCRETFMPAGPETTLEAFRGAMARHRHRHEPDQLVDVAVRSLVCDKPEQQAARMFLLLVARMEEKSRRCPLGHRVVMSTSGGTTFHCECLPDHTCATSHTLPLKFVLLLVIVLLVSCVAAYHVLFPPRKPV